MCAGIEIPGATTELGSIDLTQVVSTEYRADAVILIRRDHEITAAVIVEVQRTDDRRKTLAWPVYVTTLRKALDGCPVMLLVIVQDEALGRWARRPIEIGHPGFCLRPIVVSYADVPRVTDPTMAVRAPELALLSALAHGDEAMAPAVAAAFGELAADVKELYSDVILAAWPEAARILLENLMISPEVREEVRRAAFAKGVEVGRAKGVEVGRAEADIEARKRATETVIAVLGSRGLVASTDERRRMIDEHDLGRIYRWLAAAATCTSIADLLAV